ncbi:MAG: KAP family P-loop NTPase fold protein [Rhodomicrobiaceae bacterium]
MAKSDLNFQDSRKLEIWLLDKPIEWAQVIAARAALRVFPTVLDARPDLILHTFRAIFISWAARKYPDQDMRTAAYATYTKDSFSSAADYSAYVTSLIEATSAAKGASITASTAATIFDDDHSVFWKTVSFDASLLEQKGQTNVLIDQPLWLVEENDQTNQNFKDAFDWVLERLDEFANNEAQENKHWQLIVDWYKTLLPTELKQKPYSFFGKKADLAIATQPDEFWEPGEDDKGTEAVLADIAKIVEENPRDDSSPDEKSINKRHFQRDDADPHSDEATAEDELGRRGFARQLVERLNKVRDAGQEDGFAVHLHASWGAGKSSLFLMMQDYMASSGKNVGALPPPEKDWIVVNFNAWQHEHRNPPWWPLIEAVKRDCSRFWLCRMKDAFSGKFNRKNNKELPKTKWQSFIVFVSAFKNMIFYTSLFRWKWLQDRWWKWKFKADWAPSILAIFILGGLLLYGLHSTEIVKNIPTYVKAITAFGGFFAAFATITHRLVFGNSDDAKFYFQLTSNPLGRIQTLFQKIITTTNRPVCIFIDDLDRCNADFTVDLLEGIQTAFRHPKVTYVVAADKAWIRSAFETRYESFAPHVGEKEMPLGYLFLEKIFQMSTPLPGISDDVKQNFFDNLLGTSKKSENLKAAQHQETQAATFDAKVAEHVKTLSAKHKEGFGTNAAETELKEDNTPEKRAAVVQMLDASPGAEEEANHLLSELASLLSGNPREMKRLLNAYGMRRTIHFLEFSTPEGETKSAVEKEDIAMETLFRWTIIEQTYPALADILIERPQLIDYFNGIAKSEEAPDSIKHFMHLDKVRRIVSKKGLPMITEEIIGIITKGSSN